ncbi:MAG: DUF1543 domain-containing protein [Chitinophagaceae bacterium]
MPKLFMLLIGAVPPGRNTEQHDIFFGVAEELKELIPDVIDFWPETNGKLHFDAWREVKMVNGYSVNVEAATDKTTESSARLFFINLGGYKPNEFEEFHYKMIIAAKDKGEAVAKAKETAFYKHTGFKGADSHIDDKFGIDVDDIFEIRDILNNKTKEKYRIVVTLAAQNTAEDEIHLGYFKLSSFV